MGSGGGRGGWGAPAEGGGGPGGGGGGGGPPMFIGGGATGGATESTAGCPWKGEPGGRVQCASTGFSEPTTRLGNRITEKQGEMKLCKAFKHGEEK